MRVYHSQCSYAHCAATRSQQPVGIVTGDTVGKTVHLVDHSGTDVTAAIPGDGSCVACIELREQDGSVHERFHRNAYGTSFQVYQPNKWDAEYVAKQRQKLGEQLSAERETIMV